MKAIKQNLRFLGVIFYVAAKLSSKSKQWVLAEKLYQQSQNLQYKTQTSSYKRAATLFNNGNLDKTINILRDHLATYRDVEAIYLLAKCYMKLEYYKDSASLLESNLDLIQQQSSHLDILARAYLKQNKIIEYTRIIEMIERVESNEHRIKQLCFAYGRIGAFDSLENKLQQSLGATPFSNQQKNQFITAAISGMLRSFYYYEALKLLNNIHAHWPLTGKQLLDLAMIHEVQNDPDSALKAYMKLVSTSPEYAWWANYRSAVIYYNNKKFKKSYTLIRQVFLKKSGSRIKLNKYKNIPQVRGLAEGFILGEDGKYKQSVYAIIKCLPGWNIDFIDNNEYDIFYQSHRIIYQLLNTADSPGSSIITDYLEVHTSYAELLTKRRLWNTLCTSLYKTMGTFKKNRLTPPIECYRMFARALNNSCSFDDALRVVDEGIKIYPNALDIYVEKMNILRTQTNIYESRKVVDYILQNFDHHSLSPWVFTSICEVYVWNLDLYSLENTIRIASDVLGDKNQTLIYYIFHTTCKKLSNLTIEENITGNGIYTEAYNKRLLAKQVIKLSKQIALYSFNDENTHRTKQALVTSWSLMINNEWNKKGNVKQLIDRLFNLLDIEMPIELEQSIKQLILTSRSNKPVGIDDVERIINNTDSQELSLDEWLIIHQILVSNKFLRLGYLAREKAVMQASNVKRVGYLATPYILEKAFQSLIERSLFHEAQQVLEHINKCYPEQPTNTQLRRLLQIQTNRPQFIENNSSHKSDKHYRDLIYNRTVAIVGPAHSELLLGKEIDRHDTVIRFNYRGASHSIDSDYYGARTDIAYQNGPNLRAYFKAGVPSYMKNISMYNVEFLINKSLLSQVAQGRARNNGVRARLFNGVMMAVPAAVFDVYRYHPQSISLYGCNFYLSTIPYRKSYTLHQGKSRYSDHGKPGINRLLELVSAHDLISQRRFIGNLVKNGVIDVDRNCLSVINLSDIEYMERIELLYSYD